MTHTKPDPTDITDVQWAIVEPLIPAPLPGGRRRSVKRREIFNSLFALLAAGCAWRMMPHNFPPWSTVDHDFRTSVKTFRTSSHSP